MGHGPHHDLVRAAQRGDEAAQMRVVEQWAAKALAWCRRLGGPTIDAEDAAHDALITAIRRLPTLDDPARAEAWLYGIVRRTLAWHRRRSWWARWLPGTSEAASSRPDAFADAARSQAARRVAALLDALPEAQREVLVVCVVEERTTVEAAALLGVPEGTIKSRLRLARERVRAMPDAAALAADLAEEEPC